MCGAFLFLRYTVCMKEYKIFVTVFVITFLLLAVSYTFSTRSVQAPVTEQSQTVPLRFEIVRTPEAQAQGLSGRRDVPSGYGMLFVFDKADMYSFWMKDMLVPIDIIWLEEDGTIVGIEDSVMPESYPDTTFDAPIPVRLVLELRAGEAQRQGWSVGDTVVLPANWQN
jgi:uncharacterized membrane protein (UPF0127 family)